jgi:RNA polymerase sigma-32 factor
VERKRSKAARKSRERAQPAVEHAPETPALNPGPERAAEPENLPQTASAELPIELEEADDYGEPAASADAVEDSAESAGEARAESGALVQFDPLSRYLAEIRRFPLLSREEELVIAQRYNQDHDPQDAYRLVTANLRLVVKIAYEFARASKNLLDLIQEGNVGLMEAVKNFDPNRGIRFPSYAVWWVRAYIYRYLINNWRLVKIGTTQAQRKLFFNLRKEMERLQAEGISPQPRLLAQRLGVKEREVVEMQERLGHSELSLDQPVGSDEETHLLDILPDPARNPENQLADAQFREFARDKIEGFAKTLSGKELEIFRHRLLSEEPLTLQAMGERFGISRERVRQIETRLKRELREYVKSQAPDIEQART